MIINHKKGNGRFVILVVDNYRQRHPSRNTENSSLIRTLRWWEFSCEFTPTFSLDYKTISTVKNMSEEFAKESFCHTWIVELLLEVKKDTLWKKGQKLFRTKSCPKVGFVENLLWPFWCFIPVISGYVKSPWNYLTLFLENQL